MLADASPNDLPGADKYFFVTLLNNGRLLFAFEDSTDADFSLQTGVNNISAGVWTHICFTTIPRRVVILWVPIMPLLSAAVS